MPKLCTYVVRKDTGRAPNPYWGYCSVAVCTPNHQGAKLDHGDWLAGFLTKKRGHRFLFAVVVSERIHMNDYFHDPRFRAKKPNLRGSWKERCGDNFYSQAKDGSWKQQRNRFHIGPEALAKDTRRPYVFVGERFWYFGQDAFSVPKRFLLLVGGRGIRVNHEEDLATRFLGWVLRHDEGLHALPSDNPDLPDLISKSADGQ